MTPDSAFLDTMIATPDDESLRLVYADSLEERGEQPLDRRRKAIPTVPTGQTAAKAW